MIDYLVQRFTYHNREEWIENIKRGKIMLDDRYPYINEKILPGMILVYDPGDFEEPPANLGYSIIYEDEWFLGINKPANLLVHRAGKSFRNNLIYQLRHVRQPPFKTAHTVHRLDRDTSGVILVAKTAQARAEVGKQFLEANIEKEYIAIVHGIVDIANHSEICLPIGKSATSEISYKFAVDPQGKAATTILKQCISLGNNHSMLIVKPLTGRTHQIRIHLSAIGHGIVGDKLYGLNDEQYLQWRDNPEQRKDELQFPRHALHCRMMSFFHPYSKKIVSLEASLPEDMLELIEKLKKL
ncbi:MAG TPA: RluA family pseudouridine synthase [Chitinispirillaceae bacterium]|nr:RluA family pseudouridine synthase [Chitinispirillaceae bacterium]